VVKAKLIRVYLFFIVWTGLMMTAIFATPTAPGWTISLSASAGIQANSGAW
jgi:hypothetical protein